MNLQELLDLAPAVRGASLRRTGEDVITIVRESDGSRASVRFMSAVELSPYQPETDIIAVVRWVLPRSTSPAELGNVNAGLVLGVATSKRYDNLHDKRENTFFRAQMRAQGLEAARFLKALAHDLGLEESIPALAPVSLDEVATSLTRSPVKTKEQALLDALMGDDPSVDPPSYELHDGVLIGPSSIGASRERARSAGPIEVEIGLNALGLVVVRHTAAARDGEDPDTVADSIAAEVSSDETSVHYHRAHSHGGRVRIEVTSSLGEIGTELFTSKVRGVEIAVSSYLASP